MVSLRGILAEDGYELKRKTNDEYAGPCPFCGGEDRFLVWPEQKNGGRYWCRQCERQGDLIQYLRDKRGLSYREATEMAGKTGDRPQGKSLGEPVAIYDYTDAKGRLLFQVCRYQTPGEKTFWQRRPDGDGGWIWGLSAGEYGRRQGERDWRKIVEGKSYAEKRTFPACPLVPYRLPEVLKAETVFLPEGEKDADLLSEKFGLTASCNPMGAGKWRAEYNPHFQDKKVIILPDNDEAGHKHGQDVARNLLGTAVSLKIVELPGLPAKGDVSDWFEAGGTTEQLKALVEMNLEWEPSPGEAGANADNPLEGTQYVIEGGRLCYLKPVSSKGHTTFITVPLSNFVARCTGEILRDDGRELSREFVVTGSLDNGQPLPQVCMKAGEFKGMGWVNRHWGMSANIAAGQASQDRLREAIQHLSKGVRQRHIFTHSGWRKINGVWAFFHGGGAINGPDGVEVELEAALRRYTLPAPGGKETARASLDLLNVAPWEITAPLMACTYLAPLADLLNVDFTLWLLGLTGSLKSTLAALFLSHFGNFERKTLPGEWSSTANALERRAYILKDLPFVVDDFAPPHDSVKARELESKAHRLVRAIGNKSGRQRLSGDMTERLTFDPRCLLISTGELTPTGQSLAARYFTVEFDRERINLVNLTEAQKRKHLYPQAMSAYLSWLAPQLDEMLDEARGLWDGFRAAAQSKGHMRVPEMVAWLALGFYQFLKFQEHMGVIDDLNDLEDKAWKVFIALAQGHSRLIEGERPTLKFLNALRELFIQKRVYVLGTDGNTPQGHDELGWENYEESEHARHIGWADDNNIYLMPEATFEVVQEVFRKQQSFLGLGKNSLFKALSKEKFIEPSVEGENTRQKKIKGRNQRVLYLRKDVITGEW